MSSLTESSSSVEHFFACAPPAEIQEIERDVSSIVTVDEEKILSYHRRYNLENFVVAKTPSGKPLLVCSTGEVAEGKYLDPNSKLVFQFDHKLKTWGEDSTEYDGETDEKTEELRSCVQQRMDSYLQQHYASGSDLAAAVVYAEEGKLSIYISGVAAALRNYWTGRWVANYTVDFSESSAQVSGYCKLLAHYFEDGNIQMSTNKNLDKTECNGTDASSLADEIGKCISAFESKLHKELNSVYAKISSTALKDFRRILPITKQKFEWSGALAPILKGQK